MVFLLEISLFPLCFCFIHTHLSLSHFLSSLISFDFELWVLLCVLCFVFFMKIDFFCSYSCWAFSACGALEGVWAIAGNDLVDFSPQQLVDCDTEVDMGCKGGLMDEVCV